MTKNIKFGIYDITGKLISVTNGILNHVVYAAKSFKLTVTLNPNYSDDDEGKLIGRLDNKLYYSKSNRIT